MGRATTWIVLPAFNEADNLRELVPHIVGVCCATGLDFHVLVVDDGSSDGTVAVMDELCATHPTVGCLALRRNTGKAEALRQGFTVALDRGAATIVMMDADGQDDPDELPHLLAAHVTAPGVVTGARVVRRDRLVKRATSRLYNTVTGVVSGAPGRDFNSGYKILSADAARDVLPMLYGEMHRYLTVLAHASGYPVQEVAVNHRPRLHGATKYGVTRFWRGLMDLITVRFLMSYKSRPSHLFGGLGAAALLVGSILLGYMSLLRLSGETIGNRPALLAGVLLFLGDCSCCCSACLPS